MSKDAVATMGTILPDDVGGRDAVHVAVFSAICKRRLRPGDGLEILERGEIDTTVGPDSDGVAIVDPFLTDMVKPGQRFWAYLLPRTITSLSHRWSHPAFEDAVTTYAPPVVKLASEEWLRSFCRDADCPGYEEVIGAAARFVNGGGGGGYDDEYLHFNDRDAHGDIPPEFWDHVAVVLGVKIEGPKPAYFSCAC